MSPDTATCEPHADPLAGYASPLQIRAFTNGDETAWEDFVARSPQTTFFHRAGWRRIVGILPLIRVRSRLFSGDQGGLRRCGGDLDRRRA